MTTTQLSIRARIGLLNRTTGLRCLGRVRGQGNERSRLQAAHHLGDRGHRGQSRHRNRLGHGPHGGSVGIETWDDTSYSERGVTAASGAWTASFATDVGPEPWQQHFDIVPGTDGAAIEKKGTGTAPRRDRVSRGRLSAYLRVRTRSRDGSGSHPRR